MNALEQLAKAEALLRQLETTTRQEGLHHSSCKIVDYFRERPPRFYPTPAKVTKSMVLCAYCHATHNPNQFMHGTSNWFAAVANSLNEQMEQPK